MATRRLFSRHGSSPPSVVLRPPHAQLLPPRHHLLPLRRAPSSSWPPLTTPSFRPFSHGRPQARQHYDPDYHERLRTARPFLSTDGLKRVAKSRSTHGVVLFAAGSALVFYFSNIQTVPVSGRKRFNCFSEATVASVSDMQVKRIEYEVERQGGRFLPEWDPRTILVKRVMRRLIPVSGLQDQDWEVRVIDDPGTANAFVLPGGKVFVHSGILPITRTESGLAAVLGHEIAHNLAQHVAERMSQSIGINILAVSLFLLAPWVFAFVGGNGILDLLFSRPMNRMQESEADYIGLMLMAEACYDPREAAAFWGRMERAAHTGQQMEIPEFISTHPSHAHRIEKIQNWLPQAMEKRESSECNGVSSFADLFRKAMERGTIINEPSTVS